MKPNFADKTIWTGDNLDILRGMNTGRPGTAVLNLFLTFLLLIPGAILAAGCEYVR